MKNIFIIKTERVQNVKFEEVYYESSGFYGKEDIRIEDKSIPEVKPDEVLIKVRACGICGTDIHIFDGSEGAAPTPSGTVLGHEFAGEVVRCGDKVEGISAGDRVCVDPDPE